MSCEPGLLRAVETLALREAEERLFVVRRLTVPQMRTLAEYWPAWAHDGQAAPAGAWARWTIVAGRGFGKTRAGAEWVSDLARRHPGARIALVGATVEDVRKVMVGGESGLLAVARTGEQVRFTRTEGVVRFASGAEAFAYSGACPDKLRGPQHHFAWCDEIAKWRHPEETWDNLQLGLRLGAAPRALVTTTPRPSRFLKGLIDGSVESRGRMADNPHLPAAFVERMEAEYRGTRKGRAELDGELVEEVEGALWSRTLIEKCRLILPGTGRWLAAGGTEGAPRPARGPLHHPAAPDGHEQVRTSPGHPQPCRGHGVPAHPSPGEELLRVVIGVDPPASADGDACGIVACGIGAAGIGYVLGDHSERGLSPEGWAGKVVAAARAWGADCVIVESNQGGDMVRSVLATADPCLPVRPVFARYGKGKRAEPVAMLFETGKARFAGHFRELEDELCAMTRGGGWQGRGSPDRADAMVWALSELMLGRTAEPRIRRL